MIYVHGNNEAFTFNKKLLADIEYIKKAYHVDGGESPDADFVFALERYVKELEDYYEQHKSDAGDAIFCNPKPEWAKTLFKENYNITLIN